MRSVSNVVRRRLDPVSAREAILTAAETLLIEEGPDGLRLVEIAGRAGVSHPNVLYHFGSIAQLQERLAQRVAERLAAEIAAVFDGRDEPLPIERVVCAIFRVFDAGGYARLFAWLALSNNEPAFDAVADRMDALCATLAAHPALAGDGAAAGRAPRIAAALELATSAAIGFGLSGRVVDRFFRKDEARRSMPPLLGELLTTWVASTA